MKIMRLRKQPGSFESYTLEKAKLLHRCPVCGTVHEVSAARAQFAYGRQLACGPHCEAERRRRSRASYRLAHAALKTAEEARPAGRCTTAVGDRDDRDSRRNTLRLVGVSEQKAALSVTVESADVLRVRRAIFQVGGESVGILKAAPIPYSTKVRVFISIKLGALESIMTVIMRSVTACEFGRVARL